MSSERNAQLQRYHIGRMTKLLSEKDAEIARLRDALEWIEARIDGTALCLDEIQARARKALEREGEA